MKKTGWRTFAASCQRSLLSVASCDSDLMLGGVFLATFDDLAVSPLSPFF